MVFGTGDGLVAKKKASSPGRPPVEELKQYALTIRSVPAWRQWLQDLAEHRRRGMVDVIDEALEDYAKRWKFRKPPKR